MFTVGLEAIAAVKKWHKGDRNRKAPQKNSPRNNNKAARQIHGYAVRSSWIPFFLPRSFDFVAQSSLVGRRRSTPSPRGLLVLD
ncbi:hypothetical protein ACP70R_027628 [Stipagrostis hirtigluma subsp. patula]